MTLPTRRAAIALAAVAPVALAGYLTSYALDILAVLDVAVLGLTLLDGRLAAAPGRLRVRRIAPESFSTGRRSECRYTWANEGNRVARLLVRETRPSLLGDAGDRRALSIAAGETVTEVLPVDPVRRGHEEAGAIAIRSIGPLGLAVRQTRLDMPWNVMVYPSLPASRLKASIAEAVRRRDPGLRHLRHPGEGRQFESLREWVPGDDTRHIDWKATARRRKPIARQYEEERRQQVMLVLDAGRLQTEEFDGHSRLEYSVRAALWLAFAANHHDDNVGVMLFSNAVHHYVTPQRGRRGLRQILDVLAVAEPRLVEPDYPAAFRYLAMRNRKRALTVFFTDVIDRLASAALVGNVASLRPRHLPLVVTLRNPQLDRAATVRPSGAAGAYRKAAAEELIGARAEALAGVRRAGAIVLDVEPEHASRAVVDRYLELKRRGRL